MNSDNGMIPPSPVAPQELETRPPQEPAQFARPGEKYCSGCGNIIHNTAKSCPHCGVRQETVGDVNKVALVLVTFFLGGIGGHKFYLRKYVQGVFYLLFCLTLIPSAIAFVEFIIYLCTSEERLREKYPEGGNAIGVLIAVAGSFVMMFFFGIVAAVAIPQFVNYVSIAKEAAAEAELVTISVEQSVYYEENGRYAESFEELGYVPSFEGVDFVILWADAECYQAMASYQGNEEPSGYKEEIIDCNTY